MSPTRREFMIQGAGATSLLATGATLPGFLWRTAMAARPQAGQRILVVVQLTGGNDGLNTVVPYADDAYHRARPTLRVAPNDAHHLDDQLGLHPEMRALRGLYDDGLLGVVTNVGYPNPDRSHFRSMDIWHTASASPETAADGWLGRVVDRAGSDQDVPAALHLDDSALPLALRTQRQPVPSIRDLEHFALAAGNGSVEDAIAAARASASDDVLFVQRMAVSSCANARRLERVAGDTESAQAYPSYGLSGRLRQIAQLIAAEFGPRIYYTSLGGFDTHAQQGLSHGPLLRELSESVAAFQHDLDHRGLADRVVLVTFSEFGRRVMENGSRGTDHGAAAPMFVVGRSCRSGVIGAAPDLSRLQDGDVPFDVDFRRVYASLLDTWLDVPHEAILGGRYDPLPILRAAT